MKKHLVFVYGSLRSGCEGAMRIRFPDSQFIGEGSVSGNLYDLGPYPGLVSNESNLVVVGEVYEVDDELLSRLDDFEATSNYLRKQVEISMGSDRRRCWTYEPDPDSYAFSKLITSGDWIEYAKTKTDWPRKT